ncbi:MAG: CDP-glycerol glycerophosphotransferase family protein [Bacteroidota bacterium]
MIAYLATHGFAARMILQTGLVHQLRNRGHRVAIITPDATDANLMESCREAGIELIEIIPQLSFLEKQLLQFRRYLLEDIEANPALLEKHRMRANDPARKGWRRLQTRLGWWTYRLTQAVPLLRKVYRWLEPQLLYSRKLEERLAGLAPSYLVATYPVFPPEYQLLAAAGKLGVPTAMHLLSWDNISSKGAFPALADEYIVWGDEMADELKTYYQIAPAQIHRCGVPHFDLHIKSREAKSATYLEEIGLDPDRPYLFVAMSAPHFCPREIDIVEWLAAKIAEDIFGQDLQLVVRPHPQNMTGYMADTSWVDRLAILAKQDRVGVQYPALVQGSRLPWSMREADMDAFSRVLAGSTAVLNSGSTVSIDALMCGRPVILTSFDAEEERPYWFSARRLLDFTHLRRFVARGGVTVTRSFADLTIAIQTYQDEPDHLRDAREDTLRHYCYRADGRATERVVDTLDRLVTRSP